MKHPPPACRSGYRLTEGGPIRILPCCLQSWSTDSGDRRACRREALIKFVLRGTAAFFGDLWSLAEAACRSSSPRLVNSLEGCHRFLNTRFRHGSRRFKLIVHTAVAILFLVLVRESWTCSHCRSLSPCIRPGICLNGVQCR